MMIPNKKTINAKNQSSWLLCPSKSFPGKLYYFNGATGETAWSLSDSDKLFKKYTIHKVTDKSHTYPEPCGPPNDGSTNTTSTEFSNNVTNSAPRYTIPSPAFGQAVFPKYGIPEVLTSKVIWGWAPMFVPTELSQPQRQMFDQMMPTYEQPNQSMALNQFQPNRSLRPDVFQFSQNQSTSHQFSQKNSTLFRQNQTQHQFGQNQKPLQFGQNQTPHQFGQNQTPHQFGQNQATHQFGQNQRTHQFGQNQTPHQFGQNQTLHQFSENHLTTHQFSQNHSTPRFNKEQPMFGQSLFSTFKTKEVQTSIKPQTRDEACQTFEPRSRPTRLRTLSESNTTPKSALKPSRSVENLKSLFTNDIETSTVSPVYKVENATANKLSELDKNDLRLLLVAKKKNVEATVTSKSLEEQSKVHKTRESMAPRKRVTFDLHGDTSSEDTPEIDQRPDLSQEDPLQPAASSHEWYVVADTDALMTDYQCIEQYVKRDPSCRLVIPSAVRSQLNARGRGDCGAVAARQILRRLATPPDHVVVQTDDADYEHESSEDNIMRCCWELLQENYRVILITNDKKMLTEAESIDLKCYTLDEIKNGYRPLSLPAIDFKKVKIVVNNGLKPSENLFMQHVSEIKNLDHTKTNRLPENESRIKFTNADNNVGNVFCKIDNSDKLINLTKSKPSVFNSEITNVNDGITKLSISDNTKIQNRTKLIIKNALQNAEYDRNLHEKENKLTNAKHDAENKNQEMPSELDIDEIGNDTNDINIKTLYFPERKETERTKRDIIPVSGITKLNSHFNLDEELERFYVKNARIESRIKSRLDEWLCRLCQIMEDALMDVHLKERTDEKGITPIPTYKYRYLYEPIQYIAKTFKGHDNIKIIVDSFTRKLLNISTKEGDLAKNMKPNEFLKLFGFSKILLQKLKDIVHYKELYDAEDMLDDLIRNIEDPNTDADPALEPFNTPIISRNDVLEPKVEVAFRKSEKEIIDYLKKHFADWNQTDDLENETVCDKPNVVRTCGKDLNLLIIDKNKVITLDDKESKTTKETDKAKTNEPKIIRNVQIIEAFEEKMKNKEILDDESVYTLSDDSDRIEERKDSIYCSIVDDLSVSETTTDTECVRAYPLVKMFLVQVKGTLMQIFNFINVAMPEYNSQMPTDKKEDYRIKLETTRSHLTKLIERMKNIIARESGDGVTLKELVIKAGDYVDDDHVITNYKEIIAKFLGQAHILEDALTTMLSLFSDSPKDRDTGYCTNLSTFNSSSPILPTRTLRGNKMVH